MGQPCPFALTYLSTSSAPHQLVYVMYTRYKTGVTLTIHKNKEVYTTQVQVSMSTVPMQQVCPERSRNAKKQAANNEGQPCQGPSRQIRVISRGTPPWTTGPLGLPSARLCIHHHQSQRGGPPCCGEGIQQQRDGHPWHTRERHCFLPALNNRNRLTIDHNVHLCTHACKTTKGIDWIGWHGTSHTICA